MSLARNSFWAAAAAVTLTASRFGLAAIVARRLDQTGFGQFAYGQWLVDLAFLVCSLGSTGAASRYVAEYHANPEKLGALMIRWRPFAMAIPLATSAAVLLGVWLSDMHAGTIGMAMLAIWAACNGVWAMQTAVLTGMQRFDLVFHANLVAGVIMLAGALLIPLADHAVWPLFGLMALAFGAAATVGVANTRWLVSPATGSIDTESLKSVRNYAVNIWLTALLWSLVWSRGEMPVVRAYLGDAGVAHYAAAMTLFGGAIQGAMLAVSGIAPQLTRLWGSAQRDEAIAAARTIMDVQLLFCSIGALTLIFLGPEMISAAFGKSYHDAAAPLTVFAVGLLAMSVSSQNYVLQLATDARFSRNTTLLGLVLLFVSALLLTPPLGLVGTALARAGTMLVLAAISVFTATRRWGSRAVTGRNILIALALVGSSAMSLMLNDISLLTRLGLLIIALLALGTTLRDGYGRLLSAVVPTVLLRLVRTSVRSAGGPAA